MLVTPHKFAAMAGRQVTKVVMGPSSLSGFLITKQGSAFAFGRNDAGQLGLGGIAVILISYAIFTWNFIHRSCKLFRIICSGECVTWVVSASLLVLVLGDEKTRSFPRKVNVDARIMNAACGRRHALLLGEDGQVQCLFSLSLILIVTSFALLGLPHLGCCRCVLSLTPCINCLNSVLKQNLNCTHCKILHIASC